MVRDSLPEGTQKILLFAGYVEIPPCVQKASMQQAINTKALMFCAGTGNVAGLQVDAPGTLEVTFAKFRYKGNMDMFQYVSICFNEGMAMIWNSLTMFNSQTEQVQKKTTLF